MRQWGLVDLIANAYRFSGDSQAIERKVLGELHQGFAYSEMLFSLHPQMQNKIGALMIAGISDYPVNSGQSSDFWEAVLSFNPSMSSVQGGRLRALEIGGIFVDPTHPRRGPGGPADVLLTHAIHTYRPHCVIGATNNWRALSLRERAMDPHGYVTQAGTQLLTVDTINPRTHSLHSSLQQGYVSLHGHGSAQNGVVYVDPSYLPAAPTQIDPRCPSQYRATMEALATAQAESGPAYTAAVVVVSTPRNLHELFVAENYY